MARDHHPGLAQGEQPTEGPRPRPVVGWSGRRHRHGGWQGHGDTHGQQRPGHGSGHGDSGRQPVDLGIAGKDQERERKEAGIKLRQTNPKPDAGRNANDDAKCCDCQHEFHIMLRDCPRRIADGLQQPDLLTLQRDQARQGDVHQHRRDQKEDRRQHLDHGAQLLQLGIQKGVRDLILARHHPDPAVRRGQPVKRLDRPINRCAGCQLQHDVRERA